MCAVGGQGFGVCAYISLERGAVRLHRFRELVSMRIPLTSVHPAPALLWDHLSGGTTVREDDNEAGERGLSGGEISKGRRGF